MSDEITFDPPDAAVDDFEDDEFDLALLAAHRHGAQQLEDQLDVEGSLADALRSRRHHQLRSAIGRNLDAGAGLELALSRRRPDPTTVPPDNQSKRSGRQSAFGGRCPYCHGTHSSACSHQGRRATLVEIGILAKRARLVAGPDVSRPLRELDNGLVARRISREEAQGLLARAFYPFSAPKQSRRRVSWMAALDASLIILAVVSSLISIFIIEFLQWWWWLSLSPFFTLVPISLAGLALLLFLVRKGAQQALADRLTALKPRIDRLFDPSDDHAELGRRF